MAKCQKLFFSWILTSWEIFSDTKHVTVVINFYHLLVFKIYKSFFSYFIKIVSKWSYRKNKKLGLSFGMEFQDCQKKFKSISARNLDVIQQPPRTQWFIDYGRIAVSCFLKYKFGWEFYGSNNILRTNFNGLRETKRIITLI